MELRVCNGLLWIFMIHVNMYSYKILMPIFSDLGFKYRHQIYSSTGRNSQSRPILLCEQDVTNGISQFLWFTTATCIWQMTAYVHIYSHVDKCNPGFAFLFSYLRNVCFVPSGWPIKILEIKVFTCTNLNYGSTRKMACNLRTSNYVGQIL